MISRRLKQKNIALARLLIYALSIHPDEFGILPNSEGCFNIKELIKAFHEDLSWRSLHKKIIIEVVQHLDPISLEIANNKIRVRNYQIKLPQYNYKFQPPAYLYYAAPLRSYTSILKYGLIDPKETTKLILANDPQIAYCLGQRRNVNPIPFLIQTDPAIKHKVIFIKWGKLFWLANYIPAHCITTNIKKKNILARFHFKKMSSSLTSSTNLTSSLYGSFFLSTKDISKLYQNKNIKKYN